MKRVIATPHSVRRQGQHTDAATDPIIGAPVWQKRTVSAIMLNDEEPRQIGGGRNAKRGAEPDIYTGRPNSKGPAKREGQGRRRKFAP